MIEGLSHITLIVRDLDRTEELLTAVFDARKVYDSGEETFSLSKARFFIHRRWSAICVDSNDGRRGAAGANL